MIRPDYIEANDVAADLIAKRFEDLLKTQKQFIEQEAEENAD